MNETTGCILGLYVRHLMAVQSCKTTVRVLGGR